MMALKQRNLLFAKVKSVKNPKVENITHPLIQARLVVFFLSGDVSSSQDKKQSLKQGKKSTHSALDNTLLLVLI